MTNHRQPSAASLPHRLFVALAGTVALALALAPRAARAEGEEIREIEVVENTRTTDDTVLLIADVEKGDEWTYALGEEIKVNLISSGLFKDVSVFTTPVPGGVKLTIVAKDKHAWVLGPTFYNQPGNVGAGLGFGHANLFGENKKMLLYGQIATADSLFFGTYWDPALWGSLFYYRVDLYLRHVKMKEWLPPQDFLGDPVPIRKQTFDYLNGGFLFGFNAWRVFSIDGRLRGAWVRYTDVAWVDETRTDPAPPPQTFGENGDDAGWDVSYEVKITRDKRANWHGVMTGYLIGVNYEESLPELGSELDYWYAGARLVYGKKFYKEHNLILKLGGGYGDDLPFHQEYTSGGAPGLRGYETWQFRGDFKLGSTIEYGVPLFKIQPFSFRALVFWDSAFTTFLNEEGNTNRNYLDDVPGFAPQTETSARQWRNGVGAGFRVYIRSVVLPLLGVDVGYGLESNDYSLYLAVGLVEF